MPTWRNAAFGSQVSRGWPRAMADKASTPLRSVALTRRVSLSFASAQRQHDDGPLEASAAEEEHMHMVGLVRDLMTAVQPESRVVELPGDASHPDCSFIEDCVVPLPGWAFFVCSLHPSRQGEVGPVATAVAAERWQECGRADPGEGEFIEGGDVLAVVGDDTIHHFFVGVGNRSNAKGCAALRRALRRSLRNVKNFWDNKETGQGGESIVFRVHEVSLEGTGWLHLKSAVTHVVGAGFLATGADCPVLRRMRACLGETDAATLGAQMDDPCVVPRHATNALTLPGGAVLAHPDATGAIRDRRKKGDAGLWHILDIYGVAYPELARADGALTCGVLVLDSDYDWRIVRPEG